jgi:hypothetical protein
MTSIGALPTRLLIVGSQSAVLLLHDKISEVSETSEICCVCRKEKRPKGIP